MSTTMMQAVIEMVQPCGTAAGRIRRTVPVAVLHEARTARLVYSGAEYELRGLDGHLIGWLVRHHDCWDSDGRQIWCALREDDDGIPGELAAARVSLMDGIQAILGRPRSPGHYRMADRGLGHPAAKSQRITFVIR